jgi:predicted DNA-binding transcriptional regulator YafY
MRASRLLHMLLLLQNRGRLTSAALAGELEVTRRTVLRDVDALTEAGLPMVVSRGHRGGIELGFNYRTRLTGLAADEAEAIGVILTQPLGELVALGMADAAARARRKLMESLPDPVREGAALAARRFRFVGRISADDDPRLPALATAIRDTRLVRINAHQPMERVVHPVALVYEPDGWSLEDDLSPNAPVRLAACGPINVSSRTFTPRRADPPDLRSVPRSGTTQRPACAVPEIASPCVLTTSPRGRSPRRGSP